MSEQEVLKYLMDIFPVVGHAEGKPLIEMKYKMQFGGSEEASEELISVLDTLVEKEYLTEYEFNGTTNYKARKDIPISLSGGGGAPAPSVDNGALSDLVMALAEASDDPNVKEALAKYKESQ